MKNQSGRINPGLAIVLAIVAVGFFLVTSRSCYWAPGIHDTRWFGSAWGFLGFSGLLQLILGVWVGIDAQKRGSNGYFWGLLVFFTSIVGLLVYLLWVTDAIEKISREVNQRNVVLPRDHRDPFSARLHGSFGGIWNSFGRLLYHGGCILDLLPMSHHLPVIKIYRKVFADKGLSNPGQ